jgi:hypothetical protein
VKRALKVNPSPIAAISTPELKQTINFDMYSITRIQLQEDMKRPHFTNSTDGGSLDMAKANVPVLFVHNKDDGCSSSPYQDPSHLQSRFTASPKVTFITLQGGKPKPE